MGNDLGNVSAGFDDNFAYNTLVLGSNDYVRLVDLQNNSGSSSPEALYVNTLIVPSGSTLDLNGLHLYYRDAEINGTIIAGSATHLAGGGPFPLNTSNPGNLQISGEVNNWTFFGRAGQPVNVFLHTGSGGTPTPIQPALDYGQITLVNPQGHSISIAHNSVSGTDASILNQVLPVNGIYDIEVQAAPATAESTGNYVIAAYDATVYTSPIDLNQTVHGQLISQYNQDAWTFAAVANTQVQFNLISTTSSALRFSLTGPGGFTVFGDLSSSSGLVNLPASGTYILAVSATQTATNAYSFQLQETTVTNLTLGTSYQGTLVGSGQAQLFTVQVASAGDLGIVLSDANANDENEVYLSFRTAPTRNTYEYRYPSTGASQVLALAAQPGTYYILVYNNLVTSPGSSYSLVASAGAFVLAGLTTKEVANTQDDLLLLTGVFPMAYASDDAYRIQFVSPNGTIYPSSPIYLSPTSLGVNSGTNETASGEMTMVATLPANTLGLAATQSW